MCSKPTHVSLQHFDSTGFCSQVVDLASRLSKKMHQLFSVVHNDIPTKVSWFRLCAAAIAT